ncbi:sensor domain-containing diguanylate cyclase [Hydrogenovibrio sp. SC-1]|uniref:sensor domain-containing diguanylate cyclase n=1 Tax=Hydrogenovibrio sp. SC-1 TaxID=2065820 RepID=UPI001E41FBD1|nr:sensor domain-containing diguanylate cyclase [Hydrogenovibrio sp. SC-1]
MNQKILNLINDSETIVFYCKYAPNWPVLFLTENFNYFGYSPSLLLAQQISYPDIIHPQDFSELEAQVTDAAMSDMAFLSKWVRLKKADETYVWVDIRITFERDTSGQVSHLLGKIVDVTRTVEAEEKLQLFAQVIHQTADLIKITDKAGKLIFVNQALLDKTGYTEAELLGKNPAILKSEQRDSNIIAEMWQTISAGKIYRHRLVNRCKDGTTYCEEMTISPIFNRDGEIEYYVSTGKDVTDQVKLQQTLNDLAMKDPLTNLWNRRYMTEAIETEIKILDREPSEFGVMMLDVDRFKAINDQFGHDVGDDCLICVAKLLSKTIRSTDIIGRWGGEEFLLLVRGVDAIGMARLAEKLRTKVRGYEFSKVGQVSMSIGITAYVQHEPVNALLKRADEALYLAKNNGRDRVELM